MQWPVPSEQRRGMNQLELEQLWPDKRQGSKGDRKRGVAWQPLEEDGDPGVGSEASGSSRMVARRSPERVVASAQDGMREFGADIDQCDYMLNEEELPWGQFSEEDFGL